MSQGQGSVSYQTPQKAGGSGSGTVSAADNGLSLSSPSTVVLGNDVGAAGQPAQLLSYREIDLGGFGIIFDWSTSLVTSLFEIDAGGVAMLEYYKGTAGKEPFELITVQGKNPGLNPYGNFWATLDESLVNPDGQIDAVWQWGYNQDGTGGTMLAGEAALWWTIESHFEVGGSIQFEVELASVSRTGLSNRYIQMDINKISGGCITMLAWDSLSIAATNSAFADVYFVLGGTTGQMQLIGTAPSLTMTNTNPLQGQFSVVSNPDGSLNISNQTTGGNPEIRFSNPLFVDNTDAAFGAINIDLANQDNVEGIFMDGTVSAGSGTAFPLFAEIDASGPIIAFMDNIGVGDTYYVARAAVGNGNSQIQFSNGNNSKVFTHGLLQASSNFVMTNGTSVGLGNNLWTMTPSAQAGFGGQTAPTAFIHAAASPGGANPGMGPLKLTAGPLLTVPEDGLFEYDGTHLYFTIGVVRNTLI
jgi:hypothetical protein